MILQTVEKHCECAQSSKKSLKFTNIKMEDMVIAMNRLEIVEEPVVIIEDRKATTTVGMIGCSISRWRRPCSRRSAAVARGGAGAWKL